MSSPMEPPIAVYTHSNKPEWGRAVALDVFPDRTIYAFETGGRRTFMNDNAAIHRITVPAEEREALSKKLHREHAAVNPRPKKPKTNAPVAEATFDRQLAAFKAMFPAGFADPEYLREERGASADGEKRIDGGLARAKDLFSIERLDAALKRSAFEEIFSNAMRVLASLQSLSLPKTDKPGLERTPEVLREGYARALRELLHGTGPYEARFDALMSVNPQPWTIMTVFAAAFHPSEHCFVKATLNQKQARALGIPDPSAEAPSGTHYAHHRDVVLALRDRLVAAGLTPRDLFDVYTFSARTLTRSVQRKQPA